MKKMTILITFMFITICSFGQIKDLTKKLEINLGFEQMDYRYKGKSQFDCKYFITGLGYNLNNNFCLLINLAYAPNNKLYLGSKYIGDVKRCSASVNIRLYPLPNDFFKPYISLGHVVDSYSYEYNNVYEKTKKFVNNSDGSLVMCLGTDFIIENSKIGFYYKYHFKTLKGFCDTNFMYSGFGFKLGFFL